MPEGPSGAPRPLAEAELFIRLKYLSVQKEVNTNQVTQSVISDITELDTQVNVNTTYDIRNVSNNTSGEDTVVTVHVENSVGAIRRLVNYGSNEIMEVNADIINSTKSASNVQVDKAPDRVTIGIE